MSTSAGSPPRRRRRPSSSARRLSLAKPVDFVVDGHRFHVKASELGLTTNWTAAVAAARHQGDGFGPIRGFRRMKVRLFGQDVSAHATYDQAKLTALLGRIGSAVDEPHHEASVVLRGLHPAVVQARVGRILDRDVAGQAIVGALARLRTRERRPAADQGRRAEGDRADARARCSRKRGWRSRRRSRSSAEAPPHPALEDRAGARAAQGRRDEAPHRRPGCGRARQEPPEAGQHQVTRRAVRRHLTAASGSSRPSTRASSTCRRRPRGCSRPPSRTANRSAPIVVASSAAEADDRRRAGDGDHRHRLELHDLVRRRAEPDPQRPGRLAPRRQHADRRRARSSRSTARPASGTRRRACSRRP